MSRYILLFTIFLFSSILNISSQIQNGQPPVFGAQVFIEPGQSEAETELWFRRMKENGMKICRIRMFETYMRDAAGNWDFTLFDRAFRLAEKYDVKILATLFPQTGKDDIGGYKFPDNEEVYLNLLQYIRAVVSHFKSYPALYGWVLINEPGMGGNLPFGDFTKKKWKEWSKAHSVDRKGYTGYPLLIDLNNQRFLQDYNTWFLQLLAHEVKKYDTDTHIHENNHDIFKNCAEYDFPRWRTFLSSLGGSAHPSWHFGYFKRDKYTLAMSANSEILRSGAGNLPWLMTEIQGGNNTYSGYEPFCPTKEEIEQWLWIIIASGGKGGIFWSLNPRASGLEAGEWALLNFQNEPSDRIEAIRKVAGVVDANKGFLSGARVAESGISILYVRESLWAESKMLIKSPVPYEGRMPGGVMKSALSYFEVLTYMGGNPSLKEFGEFDFSKTDYTGETIVLSHQIALPAAYCQQLEHFVSKGGKLIVDGLTAFFNENMINTMKTGFPFQNLFGGNISEFKAMGNLFELEYRGDLTLPVHLWKGLISVNTGTVVAESDHKPIAVRNRFGKGEVLWIPSLVGLGARISDNNESLYRLMKDEVKIEYPFQLKGYHPGVIIKVLKSGNSFMTILINKTDQNLSVEVDTDLKPVRIVYPENSKLEYSKIFAISSEATMVIEWVLPCAQGDVSSR